MMDNQLKIDDKYYSSDRFAKFDEFRRSQQYCDFKIKCGAEVILVHKSIMSASSEYFEAMFRHDTLEKQNGVVELQEDPESVVTCVDFMYTGKAVMSARKHVLEIIQVARFLQIQRLCDQLGNVLKRLMGPRSFFDTRKVAITYGLERLSKCCDEFAEDNFCGIMKEDKFSGLEEEYLESLLSSPNLNLLDNVKCKALMIWVNNNHERASSLFNLMKLIDMSKVRVSYRKLLLDDPTVLQSPQCLEYIRSSISNRNNLPPLDYSGDCNLHVLTYNSSLPTTRCLDLETKALSEICRPTAVKICTPGLIFLFDKYLYLLCLDGRDNRKLFRRSFMEQNAKWEKLRSPPRFNYLGAVTVLNGMLYHWASDLYRCNLAKDSWLKPLKGIVHGDPGCMTVAHEKLICVSEKLRNCDHGSRVECFDPTTSTCSFLAPLNIARIGATTCTQKNVVYVFGGSSEYRSEYFQSFEVLYSLDSQWELVNLKGLERCCLKSHCINGKIFLVGGDDPADGDETIVVFDPESKSLCQIATLPRGYLANTENISAMVVL